MATERQMGNEEREMKEFTRRNLQQIRELKDGKHSVRSVIQSTYNPVDLLEAAQRATQRRAAHGSGKSRIPTRTRPSPRKTKKKRNYGEPSKR